MALAVVCPGTINSGEVINTMAIPPALEVQRILRVDHAGEHGAIAIYTAQLLVARWLWPELVPHLMAMRGHEQKHFARFEHELTTRRLRSCHALPLWYLGGWLLGFFSALLGRRAIWGCTAAVEHTVCQHLKTQIVFLQEYDAEALSAVRSIETDEQGHLDHAMAHGGDRVGIGRLVWPLVTKATALAIILSHWF